MLDYSQNLGNPLSRTFPISMLGDKFYQAPVKVYFKLTVFILIYPVVYFSEYRPNSFPGFSFHSNIFDDTAKKKKKSSKKKKKKSELRETLERGRDRNVNRTCT